MSQEAARRMAAGGRKAQSTPDTEIRKNGNKEIRKNGNKEIRKPGWQPVFAVAPKSYAKRFTVDLTESDHHALKMAAVENSATAADLLRGLLRLAMDDPELWIEAMEAGD